jgi:hypothetical protein
MIDGAKVGTYVLKIEDYLLISVETCIYNNFCNLKTYLIESSFSAQEKIKDINKSSFNNYQKNFFY